MAGPLSALYGLFSRARVSLYQRQWLKSVRLPRPVVSVGNISLGGTGKTPLAAYLAKTLLGAGQDPVVLSRGYRGRAEKLNLLVSDGRSILCTPQECGDEPFMLATHAGVAVAVGRRREISARLALERIPKAVFILDDGFQHLRLKRDLDLLLIDSDDPFAGNRPLPAGRLREPLQAVRRADWLLITRSHRLSEDRRRYLEQSLRELHPTAPIYWFAHRALGAVEVVSGEVRPIDGFRGKPVLPLAGIGRPQQFLEDLRDLGMKLVDDRLFADHHWYSQQDLDELTAAARKHGAVVVTTEKDAVRLKGLELEPERVFALRIEALPEDEGFIDDFLRGLPFDARQVPRGRRKTL